jgi:phosphoribosylformimino-5-aminoimidazole carboxamide ribotide isomerase
MDIFPAIDLRAGQVVRLAQGDYDRQTVYGNSPAAIARQFVAAGARWIHVVDLDAAKSGQRTNAEAIREICRSGEVRVELGGGIRDDASAAAALELGVRRVIIGSAALKDWAWFERLCRRQEMAGRIVLGLDARDGQLAVHGWTQDSGQSADEVAVKAALLPLAAIVYTDIGRDGMLTGPDLTRTARLVKQTRLPIIASGGVTTLDDVKACRDAGCAGAIIGKAWYEGKIDLPAAIALATGP